MRFKPPILKPFLLLLGAATVINLASLSDLKAQGSDDLLKLIEQHTNDILTRVNDLPAYLANATQLVLAMINPMTPEKSPPFQAMQTSFTQLGDLFIQSQSKRSDKFGALNSDLLNNDGKNVFNSNNGKPNTTGIASDKNLWYANDLVYSTVLGTPFWQDKRSKGEKNASFDPVYNYIKNAAGFNIYHHIPDPSWRPTDAKTRYQSYYNTVMAVESFNGYILSNELADGNQLNTLQTTLVTQATDPTNWFAQVASENIGFVLRQILLYQSQTFVLLTQFLQLQKQMVAAQAMTNATLIASNQLNENIMVANAQGVQPS